MIVFNAQMRGSLVGTKNVPFYQVWSKFHNGILAFSETDALIYITQKLNQGPFNILVEDFPNLSNRLSIGQRIYPCNHSLIIPDARVDISLNNCKLWEEKPHEYSSTSCSRTENNLVDILKLAYLFTLTESHPFLTLIKSRGYSLELTLDTPIQRMLFSIVSDLLEAAKKQNYSKFTSFCVSLLGLGEGLTPSGDDLVAGVCYIFSLLEVECVKFIKFKNDFMTLMNKEARRKTNRLSAALIDAASKQAINDPIKSLVDEIFYEDCITYRLLSDLAVAGHTSGYDCLTGVILGIAIAWASNPEGSSVARLFSITP